MTQETEQDQRRRIAEMEKDIIGIDDLQCLSQFYLKTLSNNLNSAI